MQIVVKYQLLIEVGPTPRIPGRDMVIDTGRRCLMNRCANGMKMLWRRRVLAACLSLAATVGGLLLAGTVRAFPPQQIANGTLSFSGDPGDQITEGASETYSTSRGDAFRILSESTGLITLQVTGADGDDWFLDLDAPGSPGHPVLGQPGDLVPGTYTTAH